jgi:hypothetical protein
MGRISDRTFEHLAPSDIAINRMRRMLVKAATGLQKDGSLPGSAQDSGLFERVRGGAFITPDGADWVESYKTNLESVTLSATMLQAAE